MTDQQKQKLASLQDSYLECLAKMRPEVSISERDSTIRRHIELLIELIANESDRFVREAYAHWSMCHHEHQQSNGSGGRIGQKQDSFIEH